MINVISGRQIKEFSLDIADYCSEIPVFPETVSLEILVNSSRILIELKQLFSLIIITAFSPRRYGAGGPLSLCFFQYEICEKCSLGL